MIFNFYRSISLFLLYWCDSILIPIGLQSSFGQLYFHHLRLDYWTQPLSWLSSTNYLIHLICRPMYFGDCRLSPFCFSVGWPTSFTPIVQSNFLTNYFFDFINYFYFAHLFRGCLRRISFLTDPSTGSTIWLTVLLVDNCFDSTRLYSLHVD